MNRLHFACGLIPALFAGAPCTAGVITTFSDGTLSGWTAYGNSSSTNPGPFGGALQATAEGNPDFAMEATDTISGSGGLFALGPAEYSGDLSVYVAVSWDEFVIDYADDTLFSTGVYIGSEGSVYRTDESLGTPGTWRRRFVPLEASHWFHVNGSKTFDEVVTDVTHFWMQMEVSVAGLVVESRVDNIRLVTVPEPTAIGLVIMAATLLSLRLGRRAN
jgi:hypothetical protein